MRFFRNCIAKGMGFLWPTSAASYRTPSFLKQSLQSIDELHLSQVCSNVPLTRAERSEGTKQLRCLASS